MVAVFFGAAAFLGASVLVLVTRPDAVFLRTVGLSTTAGAYCSLISRMLHVGMSRWKTYILGNRGLLWLSSSSFLLLWCGSSLGLGGSGLLWGSLWLSSSRSVTWLLFFGGGCLLWCGFLGSWFLLDGLLVDGLLLYLLGGLLGLWCELDCAGGT